MSPEITALGLGTVLAVGALAWVLLPLFDDAAPARTVPPPRPAPADEASAIRALREIEFDRATGKLSDGDYAALRAEYAPRALAELRGTAGAERAPAALDIEARVRAYRLAHRECITCGLRPEADALYCSTCGAWLDRVCPSCAAPVVEHGATFCSTCGAGLAALAPA